MKFMKKVPVINIDSDPASASAASPALKLRPWQAHSPMWPSDRQPPWARSWALVIFLGWHLPAGQNFNAALTEMFAALLQSTVLTQILKLSMWLWMKSTISMAYKTLCVKNWYFSTDVLSLIPLLLI